jgi:hypothetical protein
MADADILIGPGCIYYAPIGEANPDETTVAYNAAWGGNWVNIGDFLEGEGVGFSMEEEVVKVWTERSTVAKNAVRTRREAMITTTLAEHSVVNMALLLDGTATTTAAGASQKGYSEIPFGSNSDLDFYKWGIEGLRKDASDNNQPVRYFFHKGFIRIAGDVEFAKTAPTGIEIEINILGDGSQSAGEELGICQIVTAAAT